MADMPIDAEKDRFIDPITDQEVEESDPDEAQLFEADEESELEELPDGSVIVKMAAASGPVEEPDFYENLAETLPSHVLAAIKTKYFDLIEKDQEAREERDRKYEEGIRRTGLGADAPGGAQFSGASRVVHPVMAEACVDFAARSIKELFPADGPTKTKVIGEATEKKTLRAERKRDFLNWQLTDQIEEYRDEQEQLLTQLPLGGSQYLKVWYDAQKKRIATEFVPIDNIYLPYAAASFYTASRITEVQDIIDEEFEQRIADGLYVDTAFVSATVEPDQSRSGAASDRVEGRKLSGENVDGLRRVFHTYTWLSIEEDSFSDGERAPYILMLDEQGNECVGLYRNWEYGDEQRKKLDWIVEFKFIPWRGAYAIGLPHLIGGLSAALTGSLRALLDSAHINNAATLLKLKGAKISGQSQQVEVTQIAEIEGAPGVDDIRKLAMPMPFNPPSPVLLQLLGWLTDAAKGVVSTAEEKIAEAGNNMPVGTAQALIEQGAVVFSSIHSRLHASQKRVLKIISRLNRWYLDELSDQQIVREIGVTREDFDVDSDIVPVSDPNIFSETQRYMQVQALAQRAQAAPQLYNQLAIEKRLLKQLKVPNAEEFLNDPKNVEPLNPALENAAMTLGRPVGAFPSQDHLAHIQVHLNYLQDPALGQNPLIAPTFVPAVLEHLKQHLTLWYLNHVEDYAKTALNRPFGVMSEKPLPPAADQMIAAIGQHVHQDSMQAFQGVMPVIQQALMLVKQFQQQQPQDPATQAFVQTSMAETQRRAAKDQGELQLKGQQLQQEGQQFMLGLQAEAAQNTEKLLSEERTKAAELSQDAIRLQNEQMETAIKAQNAIQSSIGEL